jgi:adenosylhomocysteine nucleosidase
MVEAGRERFPARLIVAALESETQGVFERAGQPVLYSGVGKVNAAIALARQLAEYRCAGRALPLVINFGSAGSRTFATGALVACRRFVQRDMDVSALGFDPGVTPFEDVPAQLEFPVVFPALPDGVCGSGDSFETGRGAFPCEVFDMEAYAFAKVCWRDRVPFACVKYITDGADHAAAGDWRTNLAQGAQAFAALYTSLENA